MFGDSSQDVFWAVGFLRARLSSSNKTQISFIFGKARVSPMKGLSIPKLELQAALLATRLKDDIVTALTVCINHVYMWTDSTTVLQWLNSTEKLPVFVANRVDEILESTTIDEWHHVLSGNNPADTGTRGIYSEALKDSSWVIGPSILRTTDWPFIPDERVINEIRLKGPSCDVDNCVETSSSFVTNVTSIKHPEYGSNWERFISFTRYKRVVAFMLRMLPSYKHFRGKDLRITDPLELDIAESKLIHLAQMESFPVESKTPSTDKPTNNSSKVATYSPFIVRLVNTEFDTMHPILLDARHTLTHLLARSLHQKHFHQGLDFMRSVLNMKYAILGLRRLRSIKNQCVTCRKRKASTIQPNMSDLHVERLGYKQPPFKLTGVGYFGPLYVPVRRSTEKRWGFLFTCLTTRAVHLEIGPPLDTSSCVMAIERFIARRGIPSTIWSDNGTNFVDAKKE